jgi:uncharacterized membrane protein
LKVTSKQVIQTKPTKEPFDYGIVLLIVIIGIILVIIGGVCVIYIIKKLSEETKEISVEEYNELKAKYHKL